jgi:hypothetical protein
MTISPLPNEPLPIRLVFKLERAEHPRLYDELIRFRKGVKRVNRLRLLAYEGLLAQNVLLVRDDMAARADARGGGAEEGASAVTNDLFAPAIEG